MKLNLENNSPFGTRSIFIDCLSGRAKPVPLGFFYIMGGMKTNLSNSGSLAQAMMNFTNRLHKFPLNLLVVSLEDIKHIAIQVRAKNPTIAIESVITHSDTTRILFWSNNEA